MKPLAVTRFFAALALTLIVCVGVPVEALSQPVRSVQSVYVRPQIGVASYVGDRNAALFSFDGGFPYAAGLELGYQFERPYSAGLAYQFAKFPSIAPEDATSARHSINALFRYTFSRNRATLRNSTGLAPYVTVGAHATFGNVPSNSTDDSKTRVAFGPLAAVGVDVPLSDYVTFFAEGTARVAFPDDATDGLEAEKFAGFDLLNTLGTGLKISLKSGATPPDIVSIQGPSRLDADQPGTFTATIDGDATLPVEYRWDWGDGEFSTGLEVTHAFSKPGRYTVTFVASNRAGSRSEALTVEVVPVVVPVPPNIRSITATPDTVDTRTPVRFTADVQGDAPLSYHWTFGDGSTSSMLSPTHIFKEAGTYTVLLRATNAAGDDLQTFRLNVAAYDTLSCPQISALNSVRFETNSSILTEAGQRAARQNVQTLRACPGMRVRITGSASPSERNQQALAEDRARAVMEFYTTNGISAQRITMDGEAGETSPPPGESRQRADTIPLR